MKKIEALKNNETGELAIPAIGETHDMYFAHPDIGNKSEYSKVTCLLIEESYLKEKIIKEETQFEQGWNTAIRTILRELNSLTK